IVMTPHGPGGPPVYEWDEELYSLDAATKTLCWLPLTRATWVERAGESCGVQEISAGTARCFSRRVKDPSTGLFVRGSVHRYSSQIHRRDLPRVGDVVERVAVERDEIRALVRLDRAGVADLQKLGAVARRGDDHLHRRHPGGRHVRHFIVRRVRRVPVGADDDARSRG